MKFLGSVFSTLNELTSPSTWFDSDAAEDTSTGATLSGHVDFACVATLSVTAHLREEATVAEGGIGTATITARQILRAQVAFAGVGASSFTAHVIEKASLADAGVGALSATGRQILRAVVSFVADSAFLVTARMLLRGAAAGSGVGAFGPTAHELLAAQLAEAGQGAFTADGHVVSGVSTIEAQVDFSALATLAVAAPALILNAQLAFGGEAAEEIGQPPVPLKPNESGGYGFEKKDIIRRPRKKHRLLEATVSFAVRASFAARPTLIAAEIRLPFLEEPTTGEVPAISNLVLPLEPALIGHIEEWTDEDMLVALFMFEEAA